MSTGAITAGPTPAAAQSKPVARPSLCLNQPEIAAIRGTMKIACTAPRSMPNDSHNSQGALTNATRSMTPQYPAAPTIIMLRGP